MSHWCPIGFCFSARNQNIPRTLPVPPLGDALRIHTQETPDTYHEASSPEPRAQHGMPANEASQQVGHIPVRKQEGHIGPSSKQGCSSEAQAQNAGAGPPACHHTGRGQQPGTEERVMMEHGVEAASSIMRWGKQTTETASSQGQIRKS
jgi:hypothetical protein